jgi:hypothetical protein
MLPLMIVFALPLQEDLAADLRKLRTDYATAELEYYRPYREAKTPEERAKAKLDPAKHPAHEFIPKFRTLAAASKGTEVAAGAWTEILRLSLGQRKSKDGVEALDTLVTEHVGAATLESLPPQLVYAGYTLGQEKVESALATIIEKSPHAAVRAAASFYCASSIMHVNNGGDPKGSARKLLDSVAASYGETSYAKRVAPLIFELEHLQVGKQAPDFEATDQDGKSFKLSDYRGKVVMLSFWGHW